MFAIDLHSTENATIMLLVLIMNIQLLIKFDRKSGIPMALVE